MYDRKVDIIAVKYEADTVHMRPPYSGECHAICYVVTLLQLLQLIVLSDAVRTTERLKLWLLKFKGYKAS